MLTSRNTVRIVVAMVMVVGSGGDGGCSGKDEEMIKYDHNGGGNGV